MAAVQYDSWPSSQALLEADGWVFYETSRYDPTVVRGYTTAFASGSPAVRRKANRPVWARLERTTELSSGPWLGTMQVAASVLSPWVAGAAMPPDEADWATGPDAHYLDAVSWQLNPLVGQELDAARDAPVASVTGTYGDCSVPATALEALRDLFTRLSIPAGV